MCEYLQVPPEISISDSVNKLAKQKHANWMMHFSAKHLPLPLATTMCDAGSCHVP